MDCTILAKTGVNVLGKKNVADVQEIKRDDKGAYISHNGRVFRRLDLERGGSQDA
jgi:hypothetical protein